MSYLNHAGTSWPKPEPVRRAVEAALREDPARWPERYERGRAAIARAFGVEDPTRLLLTPNATVALAVGVSDHPWQPGERVVTSRLEHHALARPLQLLAEQRGVEVVRARRAGDAPIDLDAVERELRRGNVRLIAVGAACNVTGELLPIAELARLAHANGARILVDGAQTAGWAALDLRALEVDLFAFTGHKALHAPWGVGGLYVAPEVMMSSPSAACELPATGAAKACAPMPGPCDVGSVDRLALAGLEAGLEWLAAPEQRGRLDRARALAAELADGARELGLALHGLEAPEKRLPTLALTAPKVAASELGRRLEARGVTGSAGLQCAPLAHEALRTEPEGVLRLSLGAQSTRADVEGALAALREALAE